MIGRRRGSPNPLFSSRDFLHYFEFHDYAVLSLCDDYAKVML